jgi:hypothetical protein
MPRVNTSAEMWTKCPEARGDIPKPGRPVFDIAEAVSQLLKEEPFRSTTRIAAQLSLRRTSVKRTLISVLGMKKFSLRWVSHDLTGSQKAQRYRFTSAAESPESRFKE